eukprot:scaffold991_cov227-Pinguiococcus_pyrenoidosus.AAC.8
MLRTSQVSWWNRAEFWREKLASVEKRKTPMKFEISPASDLIDLYYSTLKLGGISPLAQAFS